MKHFTFILLILLSLSASAQFEFFENNRVNRNEINFYFVPHYVLFSGLRFDFERINGNKGWTLGPQFYYLKRDFKPIIYGNARLTKLMGTGLALERKFIKTSTETVLGYWALGTNIAYFYTEYYSYDWVAKQLYDNTVYDYQVVNHKGSLIRLEVNATIGIEKIYWNFLNVEPYLGAGYRYTIPLLGANQTNPFESVYSFGYTGPVFILGLKFGLGKSLQQ